MTKDVLGRDKLAPGVNPAEGLAAIPHWGGKIIWGRPPPTVFKVGPLPRDEGLARLLAMPPYPAKAANPTLKGCVADGVAGMPVVDPTGAGTGLAASKSPAAGSSGQAPERARQPVLEGAFPAEPADILGGSLVPRPHRSSASATAAKPGITLTGAVTGTDHAEPSVKPAQTSDETRAPASYGVAVDIFDAPLMAGNATDAAGTGASQHQVEDVPFHARKRGKTGRTRHVFKVLAWLVFLAVLAAIAWLYYPQIQALVQPYIG